METNEIDVLQELVGSGVIPGIQPKSVCFLRLLDGRYSAFAVAYPSPYQEIYFQVASGEIYKIGKGRDDWFLEKRGIRHSLLDSEMKSGVIRVGETPSPWLAGWGDLGIVIRLECLTQDEFSDPKKKSLAAQLPEIKKTLTKA